MYPAAAFDDIEGVDLQKVAALEAIRQHCARPVYACFGDTPRLRPVAPVFHLALPETLLLRHERRNCGGHGYD